MLAFLPGMKYDAIRTGAGLQQIDSGEASYTAVSVRLYRYYRTPSCFVPAVMYAIALLNDCIVT